MPFLEIVHMTGETERRKLSRQQPVTIGSHASTDITIDEDDVEVMHCRISWGKQGYEAVAAGTAPLDINGSLVQSAVLSPGDTLRFGTVDIRYADSSTPAASTDDDTALKPLSDDELEISHTASSRKGPPEVDDIDDDDLIDDIDDDDLIDEDETEPAGGDLLSGLEALAAESRSGSKPAKPRKSKDKPARAKQPKATKPAAKAPAQAPESPEPTRQPAAPPAKKPEDELSPRLRQAMRHRQTRPGEEDPLRSPLVLALTGGAVVLLLAGAIFYGMATRQTAQQAFDQAKAVYDEGKFQNAIGEFQNFLLLHPRSEFEDSAKEFIGKAKVRQLIESATPKFPEGLEMLRAFIKENSDREEEFEVLHPEIVGYATTISVGAAKAAGRQFDPSLLQVAKEARTILNTYAPKDTPPTEILNQIESEMRASEAAILKNDVYKEHLARMKAALEAEDPAETSPLEALKARRDLLVRYPGSSPNDPSPFLRDKEVVKYFNLALSTEQKRVQFSEVDTPAVEEPRSFDGQPLTFAFHGRTNITEVSVGKSVIAVAKDCLYGVDFVTGEPVWRRVIGFDSPFFPLQESQLPSVIAFDTNFREMVRLNQTTGELIWRLPINDFVAGQPLLVDNTIYTTTEGGKLLAIDLATGLLAGELQFSQPMTGAVQLQDDQHLFVVGNEEVCYTISQRPLECVNVSYLGHQPASVDAPLLSMGPYVLMIENKTDTATLRLLDVSDPKSAAQEVATANVDGRVVDHPVIRGRDLFVPATGELIYAFSVSDDPGQPPLTPGPVFEGKGKLGESIHLLTAQNGQVWMATDALNRLQLTTDSLQPDGPPRAPGIATQPLQSVSGTLLHARRRPYTAAVTYTRTNRNPETGDGSSEVNSDWQVVLGGKLLALTAQTGNGLNLAAVNEAGHAFRVTGNQLTAQFATNAPNRLPLNPDLVDPLMGAEVSGNRIAVACGQPEPRMWIINVAGQFEGSPLLPEPLEAPPSALGDRIVAPLPGRLHVVRLSGQSAVQDFVLPTDVEQRWKCVLPAGENQIVAITEKGLVMLLKLQTSPRPHLTEVAKLELGANVIFDAAANDQLIAIADSSGKLSLFDTVRLDQVAARQFSQPISNRPFLLSGLAIAEAGRAQLHVMNTDDLADQVTLPLNAHSIAGVALDGQALRVAWKNGSVKTVQLSDGAVSGEQTVDGLIDFGPLQLGADWVVVTVDGTLHRLTTSGGQN